jgi:hypothetical protein
VTYEVPVDSAGQPDTARGILRGSADPAQEQVLRRWFEKIPIRPARFHGCAVPGVFRMSITLF